MYEMQLIEWNWDPIRDVRLNEMTEIANNSFDKIFNLMFRSMVIENKTCTFLLVKNS